jgi:N-ethylmaleimide reductase
MTDVLQDSPLLAPHRGRALSLPNRIAMAPMTRGRADDATGVPHPAAPVYYAQRAGAGLIVSEGTWPSAHGKNGPGQPGLVDDAQVAGWRRVTTAVHAAGGRIFAQLWHAGRVSHPLTLPGGQPALAPSAVRMAGKIFTRDGWTETVAPRALTIAEIEETIEAFVAAAVNALRAGFDGVELHGANGYLIHEFLADNTNLRGDRYGGATTNRLRFAVELVDAVSAAVGADRVGLRLSPANAENDLVERDPATVYRALVDTLEPRGLAYLHLVHAGDYPEFADLRPRWSGTLIGNVNAGACSMARADGERLMAEGHVDVVAYGRLFLANPDLPLRFATGAPLAEAVKDSYYGAMPDGYVDYPIADPHLAALHEQLLGEGECGTPCRA